jgi:hypothetical protein
MKTSVYRNLHNNMLSLRVGGLVVGHCNYITLEDVDLHVNLKGALLIHEGGPKKVVAWASGHPTCIAGFKPYKGRELPEMIPEFTYSGELAWEYPVRFNPKRRVDWTIETTPSLLPVDKPVTRLASLNIDVSGGIGGSLRMMGTEDFDGVGVTLPRSAWA